MCLVRLDAGLMRYSISCRQQMKITRPQVPMRVKTRLSIPDLREALASLEIDESLAPTWFPNGFEAGNLEVVSSSVSDIVNFVASSENGTTFSLDIIRYTSADYLSGTQFEKDTENIEQYSNDQQTFYILSNVDTITATWSDGLIVEQITGNISDEYMKKIIDSIGGV